MPRELCWVSVLSGEIGLDPKALFQPMESMLLSACCTSPQPGSWAQGLVREVKELLCSLLHATGCDFLPLSHVSPSLLGYFTPCTEAKDGGSTFPLPSSCFWLQGVMLLQKQIGAGSH